ncbi:hypothetical protein [Streptomyces lateritius]|uniref:hypothetical protein n=1 Tax=Streptomyces lateritius TaxID=67313 RepID=UPI001676BE21|nr:hypothetical protein [Streptomyces lateritius]
MSRRTPLPPPPPPAEIQSWPDREALLADRARAMGELNRRLLGGGRLAVFLVWVATLLLGWGFAGGGLVALEDAIDPISMMFVFVLVAIGLCVLVPAVYFLGRGVWLDREARDRLLRWAALDCDPVADARLREPVLSAAWLVLSFALCALGLWVSLAAPAELVGPGLGGYGTVAFLMGTALGLWIPGLTGFVKAIGHYRFAVRLIAPEGSRGRSPDDVPGGRSASSGRPRPE